MPTSPRKARTLLEQGRAQVVYRMPFTLQLTDATGETCQQIDLGVDPGFVKSGFSARTEDNKEVLAAELTLRQDVSNKLTERRLYRRNRRGRKWYRPPRFKNRRRQPGWLPPSLRHKLDSHEQIVSFIKKLLPITRVIVEVATFDTQKLTNPEIKGIEYQQGTLQGYEVREYLLEKWGRQCAYCGKTDVPLEIEHVVPKQPRRGEPQGTDRVDNLTVACRACNKAKGNHQPQAWLERLARSARKIDQQRAQGLRTVLKHLKQSLRATPFMNVIRKRLVSRLQAQVSFGYITNYHRVQEALEKSHVNDAFIIAGGTATRQRVTVLDVRQTHRNNRSLQINRKGFRPSIRRQRYPLQPFDLVRSLKDHRLYRVKGLFNYGTWVRLQDKQTGIIRNLAVQHVQLVTYGKGLLWTGSSEVSR
ncbi:MAG: RNA-guided endonuclease IscB [Promethearchaeota archaeon]